VDFYCAACHLVVEVDGETHATQMEYDAARTEWLEQYGCRVVRFTNAEVGEELEGVVTAILLACEEGPGTPDRPSPLSPLPADAAERGTRPDQS
jgi:very-short-patch-repair endonuclease